MVNELRNVFLRLLDATGLETKRYLFDSINLNQRLIGIVGARGVGKTTLLLQLMKVHCSLETTFYLSADHFYFNSISLYTFVRQLYEEEGIEMFLIDEIHKYPSWNQELKNIYDHFPNISIIFSGSSSIDLVTGSYDLSRRAILYHLHGLSFREYLNFTSKESYSSFTLEDCLDNPIEASLFLGKIPKIKGAFQSYLSYGFYPFFLEDKDTFYQRLMSIIEKVIYVDVANFFKLKTQNLHSLKKLLYFLATIPPGELNTHNIAKHLKIDDKTASHYLLILDKVGLLQLVYAHEGGHKLLRRPEKMSLDNASLAVAIHKETGLDLNKGMIRELFFLQSFKATRYDVFYSKVADYEVAHTLFEIGGKKKNKKQIYGHENSVLVKDDVLVGSKQSFPLMLLGFLY